MVEGVTSSAPLWKEPTSALGCDERTMTDINKHVMIRSNSTRIFMIWFHRSFLLYYFVGSYHSI